MRNFYNHIVNFFKGMFAAEGGLSSKRVVGFGCYLILVMIGVANIWFAKPIHSEYMYTISGILIACFGLNTILSSKSIQTKSDVATGLIKEQPSDTTAQDAKDVLNSDKP